MATADIKEKVKVVTAVQTFFSEVHAEMRKIVWPTPQALMQMTGAVLGIVTALAIYLGIADLVFRELFDFLIGL